MQEMTYGEAQTVKTMSLEMVNGIWRVDNLPTHKKRMKRESAMKYYSKKLNKIWENLNETNRV